MSIEKDMRALLEKEVLSEETKEALLEAWNKKVETVREEVSTELRQDFASRFEHDKSTIVEAMEKFINDSLTKEIESLVESQKKLTEQRIALEAKGKTVSEKFNKFLNDKLTEELTEFKQNRQQFSESVNKAEKFIVRKLAEELTEYEECKTKLVEERVALETEKKKEINEAKKIFIEKASTLAEQVINEAIKSEFTQLREELVEARKLTLGRKIFEAFAAEFGTNFFSESTEIKKIASKIEELNTKLTEAQNTLAAKNTELLEARKQAAVSQELVERNTTMGELLSSLNAEKRSVMRKLLESVSTVKLRESYKRFLPSVLGHSGEIIGLEKTDERKALNETASSNESSQDRRRIVEGNRKAMNKQEQNPELAELKRLSRGTF